MRPPPNFFVFREIREFRDLPYAVLKFPKLLKLPNPFTAYKRIRREFHNCRLSSYRNKFNNKMYSIAIRHI